MLSEVPVPVVYDGIKLEAGYKRDLLVEDTVIVELKAIEAFGSHSPSSNNFVFEAREEAHRFADQLSLFAFKRRHQAICSLIIGFLCVRCGSLVVCVE